MKMTLMVVVVVVVLTMDDINLIGACEGDGGLSGSFPQVHLYYPTAFTQLLPL